MAFSTIDGQMKAYRVNLGEARWKLLFFISIPLTVVITSLLYQPLAITIYRIREPHFSSPIKGKPASLIIRNDVMGEGDFGTKRQKGRSHAGVDILAPVGAYVYAAKSGIAFCANFPRGYGKHIMIYHPDGFQSIYAHLSNWAVISAKKVRRNKLIGFVGKTGNASARSIEPHLHFEIIKDGVPQNPHDLMRR